MSRIKVAARLRARRRNQEFDRAVRTAPPSMQQELLAAASHQLPR